MQSGPLGDGFWPLRIFRRIAAENPKYSRKFFCQSLPFFDFFEANSAELPQNAAELPQNSAPKNAKLTNFAWLCPKKAFFLKVFLVFAVPKKVAPKVAKGFFSDRWQTRLPAQFPKKIGEVWNGLRWETAGAALAPTMRLTKSAAKYAGGWGCFREGCTIARQWGFFWTPKPSFPGNGIRAPVWVEGVSAQNHKVEWYREWKKKTKEIQHKDLFLPPFPLFKILCVCIFPYISKRKTARTHRISGVGGP